MRPSKWSALVVDKITEGDLRQVARDGYTTWKRLPTEVVQIPTEIPDEAAILSWRWDTDQDNDASRNIWSAILLAKMLGFRYLVVDVISVDQQLTGDSLLEQVMTFSKLYETIPVIVAYDKTQTDILRAMRRPWITNEVLHLLHNPTRIIYAGHNDQGAVHGPLSFHPVWMKVLPEELEGFAFTRLVNRIWRTGLCPSIIGVLFGLFGMKDISDIKFLMPEYASILVDAFKTMHPNDYLLTAAILSQVEWDKTVLNDSPGEDLLSPADFTFQRYTIKKRTARMKWTVLDILLDGTEVASWHHEHNRYYMVENYYMHVKDNAERTIFAALGRTDAEYDKWLAQKASTKYKRRLFGNTTGQAPGFEIYSLQELSSPDPIIKLVQRTSRYKFQVELERG